LPPKTIVSSKSSADFAAETILKQPLGKNGGLTLVRPGGINGADPVFIAVLVEKG
jgi:hypothetical protein